MSVLNILESAFSCTFLLEKCFFLFRFVMAAENIIILPRVSENSSSQADQHQRALNNKPEDCQIAIGDETLLCHKSVLRGRSPVLDDLIDDSLQHCGNQQNVLSTELSAEHLSKETMKVILEYMQSGKLKLNPAKTMDIIKASDYLKMMKLRKMCSDEVPGFGIVSSDNIVDWYKIANHMEIENIKSHCEQIIADEFLVISNKTAFLDLPYKDVKPYFGNKCIYKVKPDDILHSTIQWFSHVTDQRCDDVKKMLSGHPLQSCSIKCINSVIDTYEAALDKAPELYKFFNKAILQILTTKVPTLLIIGGQSESGTVNRTCWKLDEAAGEIKQFTEIPFDALTTADHSVCKVPLGLAVTGGEDCNVCVMFIVATMSWCRLPNLLQKHYRHGSICMDGTLFVCGGSLESENACSVEFIDLGESGSWKLGPALTRPCSHPQLAFLEDRGIFLLDENHKQLLQLEQKYSSWEEVSELPTTIDTDYRGFSMTSGQDHLYVAGGKGNFFLSYNPGSYTWCKYGGLHNEHR